MQQKQLLFHRWRLNEEFEPIERFVRNQSQKNEKEKGALGPI